MIIRRILCFTHDIHSFIGSHIEKGHEQSEKKERERERHVVWTSKMALAMDGSFQWSELGIGGENREDDDLFHSPPTPFFFSCLSLFLSRLVEIGAINESSFEAKQKTSPNKITGANLIIKISITVPFAANFKRTPNLWYLMVNLL